MITGTIYTACIIAEGLFLVGDSGVSHVRDCIFHQGEASSLLGSGTICDAWLAGGAPFNPAMVAAS